MVNLQTPQSILELDEPPTFLYVADKELLRRERFTTRFLTKFANAKQREVVTFDGRSFSEKEIRIFQNSIRSLSLFAEKKCIVISHTDEIAASLLAVLTKEFKVIDSSTIVLCTGAPLQERALFRKNFDSFYIEFEDMKTPEMKRWIKKECAAQGITMIDEPSIAMIAEVGVGSTDKTSKLIEKISLFIDGPELKLQELMKFLSSSKTTSEYELLDAMMLSDKKKAIMLNSQMEMQGMNPYGFVPLIGKSTFHLLALIFAQKEKYSFDRLKSRFALSPWIINKLTAAVKKNSVRDACSLQQATLKAEIRLKSKSLPVKDILDSITFRE
jgi:DNA polymerase III delta subunit